MFHTKLNKLAVLTTLLTLAFLISSCAADNAETVSNNPELILTSNNQTDAQNQNAGFIVDSNEISTSETRSENAAETSPGTFCAEINNIAMYDTFLAQDLPDYIRLVFNDLKEASEKHLEAFEKPRGRA